MLGLRVPDGFVEGLFSLAAERLWVREFDLRLDLCRLDARADCEVDFVYGEAIVRVDLSRHSSVAELIESIVHEVAHVALMELEWLTGRVATTGGLEWVAARELAFERVVRRLVNSVLTAYPLDSWGVDLSEPTPLFDGVE